MGASAGAQARRRMRYLQTRSWHVHGVVGYGGEPWHRELVHDWMTDRSEAQSPSTKLPIGIAPQKQEQSLMTYPDGQSFVPSLGAHPANIAMNTVPANELCRAVERTWWS